MVTEDEKARVRDVVVAQRDKLDGMVRFHHGEKQQHARITEVIVVQVHALDCRVAQRAKLQQILVSDPMCDESWISSLFIAQAQGGEGLKQG